MQKTHEIWSEKKRKREIILGVFEWHGFNAR